MKKSLSALVVAASLLLSACGGGGSDEVAEPQGESPSSTVASPEAPALAFGDTVAQLPDEFEYEDSINSVSGDVDYFAAEVDDVPVLYTADGVAVPAPEGMEPKAWYVNDEGVFLFASRAGSGLTSAVDVLAKVDPTSSTTVYETPATDIELRSTAQVLLFKRTLVVDSGYFIGVDLKTGKQAYKKSVEGSYGDPDAVRTENCIGKQTGEKPRPEGGTPDAVYTLFDAETAGACAETYDPDATVVKDGTYSSRYDLARANDPEALEFYDNGKRIWSVPGVTASYLGRNDEAVVVSNTENGVLAALALSDGKELAQATINCPENVSGEMLNDDRMILNCKVSDDYTTYSIIAV